MPSRQPFTTLCQQTAQLRGETHRADLHLHTTCSDGAFSPEEIVRRAQRRGLGAVAITDHDTTAGVTPAQTAAAGSRLCVITGVEITCDNRGRELHLLAYFVRLEDAPLQSALRDLQRSRQRRYHDMVDRLRAANVRVDARSMLPDAAPGRRDLAAALVQSGHADTLQQAFARYLRDGGPVALPKRRLPVLEALELVRAADGVSSWAHPPEDIALGDVQELAAAGLDALEAVYPSFSATRTHGMRALARAAGLAITGGSDCHGPSPAKRAVGAFGVTMVEVDLLRQRRSGDDPGP